MQPKLPSIQECPVGRAVETVGEWWSILILRDALQGSTRFDEFERNLGIAPNILSRRLAHLTKTGMFVRRRYQERPPRCEYVLTDKARDFFPVIATLLAWGNKHLAPKGESILLADRNDLRPLDPVVVDAAERQPITLANAVVVAGPAASRLMRRRLTLLKAMNPDLAPAGD
ncbi:helix-turn-helix transcriptional regulator [Bradyrhizobium sp. WYCCWR 13023]|uniref:Helix-turn-helix transcriptional regulator n=1 Tax=Bradyrhizobium zhengyangense TaxID=2911009 RepID=A0A9X1U7L1_9BRAD|nr:MULTISPECIES: helix-turn-helix domain-containing protein [Bradyrhizobium]MCG2625048.1 helix-turn-helix transcriptional regulator [Bradyrhizobium zhengyangense]MCG2645185.1 helix-turn-helix transcriptional regulator [Bradyrhizobium zhengyangense]MCG2667118.1 helix-turn-helix transcriptional regulator [Bradyrhizobium zhengyangense]MDA9523707.1 transcriptional regulator [Bradyrhizobium sp. CCBAU 11434]